MRRTLVAVTGASSGIGEAFVRRLAPEHDMMLIARRVERLESLSRELLEGYGCRAEIVPADLSQPEHVERVARRIESAPDLALLVNNAGFGAGGLFWDAALEAQAGMHEVHVMATLKLTHAALRNMVPRDFGAIVNVGSVASFVRRPGSASYAASKTWVVTFTEAVYVDLKSAGSHIAVQALCPGYTYSEFHDKLGVDRRKLASAAFWHSAESIVEASLSGLRKRRLIVVPGWRYRLLATILTKIPTALRLQVETRIAGKLTRALPEPAKRAGDIAG